MVAAAFLGAAQQICSQMGCTSEEKQGLKLYQADALSRLQSNAITVTDPRPEGIQ
jgi:hypothetical protein